MSVSLHSLAALVGVDHAVLRVTDLDAAEVLWRRLGFTLTPRGFHTGRGSANHTTPFAAGDYLELLHIPPGADTSPYGDKPVGPLAVALKASDGQGLHDEIVDRGFTFAPPRPLARPVMIDGVAREARFLTVPMPQVGIPELSIFACQHFTPELVWRPEWQAHANGVTGLAGLLAVSADPAGLAPAYASLFGDDAVAETAEGIRVALGAGLLSVLAPAAFAQRFPGIELPGEAEAGVFAGVTLSADLARTAAVLEAAGVAVARPAPGRLVLAPAQTGGTLLEFTGA